jgi:cell division protein FtsQ
MTDLENEVNRQGSKTGLSRARQRKLKRERSAVTPSQGESGTSHLRSTRQRAPRHNGPSVRERLASTHINLSSPSIKSIQSNIGSKIGRATRNSKVGQTSKKLFLSGAALATHHARRKSETPRSDTHYEATPHADTQRKSNANHSFIPHKNRRVYDARSESSPPVMVRGGMGGMAFGRVATSRLQKQKAPRRRFDVPLKVQGAEIRLPSIPFIHVGWRAVSLLLVILMATGLFFIWKAPAFQIKAVEAEGLKRLTVGDLNAVMGTFGASVFTINPQTLEKILEQAFPELEKISVRVNLPADLKVAVVEREPVIAWTQDGSEVWVDERGVAFPPRGTPENSLVRVEGHGTPPGNITTAPTNDLQNLSAGIPYSPASNIPNISLSPELVSSILALGAKMPADTLLVYDSEHGLGWNDPNGWEVYFGKEDQDMEMKLSVYETLVDHLQSEGIQPELISVEFVHAPYYRMER